MLYTVGNKFEEWLLPRGRTLLVGLVAANVCLTFVLIAAQQPPTGEDLADLTEIPIDREIQLLAEAPPPATSSALTAQPAPDQPLPSQPPARECRTWGPEPTPDAFADLVVALEASGSFPEVRSREVKAPPDYLVYVGELGSRDNAKRIAKELDALSIESYLINHPETGLKLSVGVFSREKLAVKQQDRVAQLGYSVTIEELERAQTVYQLTAHVAPDSQAYESSTSACIAFAHNT